MSSTTNQVEVWALVSDVADCLHCSVDAVRKWGKAGRFGYRQAGPRKFVANLDEAVAFYSSKYPDIEINQVKIESLRQSTP